MFAGLRVDTCGGCGHAVEYRKEPSVPTGWIFRCGNPMCGYYGQDYLMPTVKAIRFYRVPKQDAA